MKYLKYGYSLSILPHVLAQKSSGRPIRIRRARNIYKIYIYIYIFFWLQHSCIIGLLYQTWVWNQTQMKFLPLLGSSFALKVSFYLSCFLNGNKYRCIIYWGVSDHHKASPNPIFFENISVRWWITTSWNK